MFGLLLSSGVIEVTLASSGKTPYFRLLFIAIEREVFNISAASLTYFGGILLKSVAFLVLILLRRF